MILRTVLIRELIRNRYGTPSDCARAWGVTRQYVGLIVHGRRPVPWWARGDLKL